MTKTHEHVAGEKHGYTFVRRFRPSTPGDMRFGYFVVIEQEERFELAPYFDHWQTADEIEEKINRNERFFNSIPCVPYETAIPRPEGVKVFRAQDFEGGKG